MNNSSHSPKAVSSVPSDAAAVVFRLEALAARSVKVAGDFTEWEKLPLKLRRSETGIWELKVNLSPGRYHYRYLVDDQWYDDPQCQQREPNPFGSTNAVVEVTPVAPSRGLTT